MNDDLQRHYEAVLLSGVYALLETLRENRFLWFAAALFFALTAIISAELWLRLVNIGGLTLALWHVVHTTRMIRDGLRLISDAEQRAEAADQ